VAKPEPDVPTVKKQRRNRLKEEEQKVAELVAEVAALQEQLERAVDEATTQQSSAESEIELVKTELSEQQGIRLETEQLKIAELVAKVTVLEEQLDTTDETTTQQDSTEPEPVVDFQVKSEAAISELKEQQRIRLEVEQLRVTELTATVTSLQSQLDRATGQMTNSSSVPATELVPVEANAKVKRIVEALLFSAEQAMTVQQLHAVFPELEAPKKQQIQEALDSLHYDYKAQGIELHKVASGYRFQVKADMAPWVARLFAEKPPKYSRALLETIAIIAYQQPVTRGDIEEIRGVSVSSNMIRTLLEREWITVLAHKEVPGRPALYGTTKQFLDYFNLESLAGMPALEELQALALEGEMEI